MGIFENRSKLTKTDIIKILAGFKTLDQAERKVLLDSLSGRLDHGGVTEGEWLQVIRDAREDHKISAIDYKYLKKAVL